MGNKLVPTPVNVVHNAEIPTTRSQAALGVGQFGFGEKGKGQQAIDELRKELGLPPVPPESITYPPYERSLSARVGSLDNGGCAFAMRNAVESGSFEQKRFVGGSLNQPNNKRGTTLPNRRGLGSQVETISHRSLINPFRPDQFYVRITANRRRWIHVFPVDEMPNNKRGTTLPNRRGLGSQVETISHRSLINPFRPDQFYVRITANRRRWIHVFPVDEMGRSKLAHHYVDGTSTVHINMIDEAPPVGNELDNKLRENGVVGSPSRRNDRPDSPLIATGPPSESTTSTATVNMK
ncbi:hypothetical protein COOONC_15177, partial [Cooperia oncophora]